MSSIYIATESGTLDVDGEQYPITARVTRVREGHPLLRTHPSLFEPADSGVHYEWEQATAAPGEKRKRARNEPKPVVEAVEDVSAPEAVEE